MIMFSRSCFEREEFSVFRSDLRPLTCTGRLQLEPFALAGVVTLHGIAALISHFFRHCL